ncbi:MAG: SoxR reducing system RseC family protein [Clostridiaceae bacterium]|nr:SoxR reducing system RseC family protein [Clostridiaceae bacterium]
MKQTATVVTIEKDTALVDVVRQSACGGDCGSCKGCGTAGQFIRVRVKNTMGAKEGDTVILETATRSIFKSAYIAYISPVVLMVAFYLLPVGSEPFKIAASFAGLLIGVGICYFYSKRLEAKGSARAEITEIVKR